MTETAPVSQAELNAEVVALAQRNGVDLEQVDRKFVLHNMQRHIDYAYEAGKTAFRRDFGQHGPTLRPVSKERTPNPYAGILAVAWDRGYQQDTRRVVAGVS